MAIYNPYLLNQGSNGYGDFGSLPAGIDPRAVAANPQGYQQWLQQGRAQEAAMPGSTMFGPGVPDASQMPAEGFESWQRSSVPAAPSSVVKETLQYNPTTGRTYDTASPMPLASQPNPTPSPAPFSQAAPTSSTPAPSQNPMTQTESQEGIAQYAMPYVETMLGATQRQLFNYDPSGNVTGMKGYTPYSYNPADYYAGFTPLQQQAQQGVANLSLPSTFGQSIGLTGQTYGNLMGLGGQAARAGQNYARQATNPFAVQQYMNPYLMSSLAPQMELLGQQQTQQGQQLAKQAAQSGAFGGSRYGIQQGLQNQANQLAMSNLVGQGYNQAYNQALQNMQYGANLGLQGQQAAAGMYGQGLTGAQQLGNLGSQALQSQQGILGLQQSTGAAQQALQQQMIDRAVQNYNTAQQYPYQQLGFMQNMLQGLPYRTTSQQAYQQAPSMMQNLAALGMGAYGLNSLLGGGGSGTGGGLTGALNSVGSGIGNLASGIGTGISNAGSWINQNLLGGYFVEGGEVKGYAEGGSVDSPQNVDSIISKLSDQQLQQALQMAVARNDMERIQDVREEMATRASERGGLAGAFNQLPQQARTQLAGGGIIAFANRGAVEDDSEGDDEPRATQPQAELPSPGNPVGYAQLGPLAVAAAKRLQSIPDFEATTPVQRAAMEKAYLEKAQRDAGESPYAGLRDYLTKAEADRAPALEQGKGLAAIAAMQGMLKPGGFMRGLGEAGGAFAGQYGQALQADRAEKRSLAQMQFNLADAERKERMGLHRDAEAAVARAEQNRLDAYKARILKETNATTALARTAQAMKPTAAGAGGRPVQPKESAVMISDLMADLKTQNPDWSPAKLKAEATKQYLAMTKSGTSGAVARTYGDATKDFQSFTTLNRSKVNEIIKDRFGGDANAFKADYIDRYMQGLPTDIYSAKQPGADKPSSSKVPPPPPGFQ